MITTDIGGPLKETKRGNKYFIVVIDHFTKFIQIHPLKRIQAEAQIMDDDIWNTRKFIIRWWHAIQK